MFLTFIITLYTAVSNILSLILYDSRGTYAYFHILITSLVKWKDKWVRIYNNKKSKCSYDSHWPVLHHFSTDLVTFSKGHRSLKIMHTGSVYGKLQSHKVWINSVPKSLKKKKNKKNKKKQLCLATWTYEKGNA